MSGLKILTLNRKRYYSRTVKSQSLARLDSVNRQGPEKLIIRVGCPEVKKLISVGLEIYFLLTSGFKDVCWFEAIRVGASWIELLK